MKNTNQYSNQLRTQTQIIAKHPNIKNNQVLKYKLQSSIQTQNITFSL